MLKKNPVLRSLFFTALFALGNVLMYFVLKRFWIGGSSFLPLVGKPGPSGVFLLAFTINMGVIAGAMLGALAGGEFRLRVPKGSRIPRAVLGGLMIGVGVTLAPGTCTTAFVTGVPMLSVSSLLSIAGIFIGGYLVFRLTVGR
jgi:hypothetical protein